MRTSADRILTAARKLAACVQKEREIKARIRWDACEQADAAEVDDLSRVTYPGHDPCCFTKDESNNYEDGNGLMRREEWCTVCETNWTLRGEVGRLRKARSSLLRGLVNAVASEVAA